jgi:outer membrane receptor protein involved in Fe transport
MKAYRFISLALQSASPIALLCTPPAFAQQTKDAQQAASDASIVVTGVLRDTLASRAPIALTNVNDQKIRDVVPVSAADLLTEIPGAVVNSDAGATKNSVYARGLSNETSAGTFGYYWTQILEDGMPVVPSRWSPIARPRGSSGWKV